MKNTEDRMLKIITIALAASLATSLAAPVALAGPAERLERLDNHLDRLERTGIIKQGSYLDRVEDRIDRRENKIDRREDRRDRAVNHGPLDRLEDRVDRLENIQDRREDRRDRRNLY
jgi:membrane peptidoglycan carboxypeptidase